MLECARQRILQYFKRINASIDTVPPSSSAALPSREGPLSSSIPPGAIASTNKKVAEGTAKKLHRGSHHVLTDEQRLMVVQLQSGILQRNTHNFCP